MCRRLTISAIAAGIFVAAGAPAHFVVAYGEAGYYSQGTYYSQSTYYSQASYYSQSTYNTNFSGNVDVYSNVSVTGTLSKGSGTFVIDHPLDPENKLLYHSFVESPDVKNIYDGIAMLDERGEATIELPAYFEALNGSYRYQLEALGAPSPNIHIKEGVAQNRFTIAGGTPGGTISWQVTGIRHDPYIRANPMPNEVAKGPLYDVPVGTYLFEGYAEPGPVRAWAAAFLDRFRSFISGI